MHKRFMARLKPCPSYRLSQISIDPLAAAVLKKDRLATIPTLRSVTWKASNHRTRHRAMRKIN